MKNKVVFALGIALIAAGMSACNKTKKAHQWLIKAGEWKVVTLTVDGVAVDELPHWEIEDCKVYKESCIGEWKNDEGGHAEFIWQFREKGTIFQVAFQENDHGHAHTDADHEAEEQCIEFSGVYNVTAHTKDKLELSSTSIAAHNGKTVIIKLEKK
jgi:hypothetical protein